MSVTSIHRPRVRRVLQELPQQPGHDADSPYDDDRMSAIEEGFRVNQTAAHLLQLGPQAAPTVRDALSTAKGLRRRGIVNALWHYHDPQDIPVFLQELHSGDTNRRRQAAAFLVDFNSADVRSGLVRALEDPAAIVRAAVIRALRRSGCGLPQNLRPTLLRDPDPGVRQAIIERTG